MLGFFIALGGIIITGWLLTRKCRLEEDLPDQIERKSFELLEVLEDENAYLVRIEIDGKQEWAKIPEIGRRSTIWTKRHNTNVLTF